VLIQLMWHEKGFLCGNHLCQLKPHNNALKTPVNFQRYL